MGDLIIKSTDGTTELLKVPEQGTTNNKIDQTELKPLADYLGVSAEELFKLFGGPLDVGSYTLAELLARIKRADPPAGDDKIQDIDGLIAKFEKLEAVLREIETKLDGLRAKSESSLTEAEKSQIKALEDAKRVIENKLEQVGKTLLDATAVANDNQKKAIMAIRDRHQYLQSSKEDKQQTQETQKAMTSSQPSGGTGVTSKAQVGGGYGGPGFSYGTSASGPGYDFSAYYASSLAQNSIMDGWGMVGQNQLQGQKMMMLFFYFARMAMSGDLYAMYQFMKFITSVIAKDKALQNIDMATKIIELQEESRKATDALVNADSSDATEFSKLMEKTKAQTSSIATSQKLIADMLQEFAQVAESLTSVTKEMLSANGILLRKVSTWS